MKASVDAGGNARWDFHSFGHNEHLADEAKNGTKHRSNNIRFKLTSRFIDELNYSKKIKKANDPKKITTRKSKYVLELAKENKFRPKFRIMKKTHRQTL